MREATTIISISSDSSDSEGDHPRPTKPAFFACYLLCSLRPRCKATYIGFTANPRRRIRQHNGVIKNGARQTKAKRPWEMVLCVYGFPSKASALKFEWAWRHPTRSVAVKKAAACLKSSQGTARKIELVYTMLTLTEWKDLNLTVNFLSTKHMKYTKGCPPLPSHMKVQICPMDELPCYQGTCGSSKGEHFSSGSGPLLCLAWDQTIDPRFKHFSALYCNSFASVLRLRQLPQERSLINLCIHLLLPIPREYVCWVLPIIIFFRACSRPLLTPHSTCPLCRTRAQPEETVLESIGVEQLSVTISEPIPSGTFPAILCDLTSAQTFLCPSRAIRYSIIVANETYGHTAEFLLLFVTSFNDRDKDTQGWWDNSNARY